MFGLLDSIRTVAIECSARPPPNASILLRNSRSNVKRQQSRDDVNFFTRVPAWIVLCICDVEQPLLEILHQLLLGACRLIALSYFSHFFGGGNTFSLRGMNILVHLGEMGIFPKISGSAVYRVSTHLKAIDRW